MNNRNHIPVNYTSTENPFPVQKSWLSSIRDSIPSSSTSIGKLILPAQWSAPSNLAEQELKTISAAYQEIIQGGFVGTYDEAVLDTIQLTPAQTFADDISEKYFIVKFCGNAMHYQDALIAYAEDADKLQSTVVAFNYRGVDKSKKTPNVFQDLVVDGITQVNRLIKNGADPEKITLDGLSLGGAVATLVAQYFHNKKQRVYLWNDRSLATLSKAAAGILAPQLPGLLYDTSFTSIETSSWSVMKASGWDVNVASAYKSIPAEYKGYMVVGKHSAKNLSAGDGVIAHKASLHWHVKDDEKKQNKRTGNKVSAYGMFGGHNKSRKQLVSQANPTKNGQELFEEFVLSHRKKSS